MHICHDDLGIIGKGKLENFIIQPFFFPQGETPMQHYSKICMWLVLQSNLV